MRLINAATLELEYFASSHNVPAYAVLSHTWEDDEVLFQEMTSNPAAARQRKGYRKILKAAELAIARGLSHVWVDTCCIDKSSSAELTEAINSMFRWYERADVCLACLSDLPADVGLDAPGGLAACRWFTRGWTLQELIAPRHVDFFDEAWNFRGSKADLADRITRITGIEKGVLDYTTPLADLAVAKRMSWAAKRQTTRIEDIAYCLLGIFDVNMPMLYGEGEKAFIRLQEEIIKTACDLSIFAWTYHAPDDAKALPSWWNPGSSWTLHQLAVPRRLSSIKESSVVPDPEKPEYSVSAYKVSRLRSPPLDTSSSAALSSAAAEYHSEYHGILADSPWHFQNCRDIRRVRGSESFSGHFSFTNRGLRISWPLDLAPVSSSSFAYRYVLNLACSTGAGLSLGVFLRKCGSDLFVRMEPEKLAFLPYEEPDNEVGQARDLYMMARVPQHRSSIASSSTPAPGSTLDLSQGSRHNNIVLRNRAVGLQALAPGSSSGMLATPHPGGLRQLQAYPPGVWDEHDMAFFEASELPRSWCVYYFDGDVRIPEATARLRYIFAFVGWAAGHSSLVKGEEAPQPQYTIVSPDELSSTKLAVFFSSLTTASHESGTWFLEHFERTFGRPVVPRSVSATVFTDGDGTRPARVTPVVDTARVPHICRNDIWRVRFEISMAHAGVEGGAAVSGSAPTDGRVSPISSTTRSNRAQSQKIQGGPQLSMGTRRMYSTHRLLPTTPQTLMVRRSRSTLSHADLRVVVRVVVGFPIFAQARRIGLRNMALARVWGVFRPSQG